MRAADALTISRATFTEKQTVDGAIKTYTYDGWALRGSLNGRRVRRQFTTRSAAVTAKERLELEAANSAASHVRPVNTRLTPAQVIIAENIFALTPDPLGAVNWYLANYRAPLASTPIENATAEFMRDRECEVSVSVIVDYRKVMTLLLKAFAGRVVDSITTPELETIMATWGASKKSWNNIRGYLHAFFAFCARHSPPWVVANPVKPIKVYDIPRGIPAITKASTLAEMFAFLETHAGPVGSGNQPGYLVPYFALATFAGIRPSVRDGELLKIHNSAEKGHIIDLAVGVIRLAPELTKTNDLRQIKIQPNLAAWLKKYPISKYPLFVANMMDHVGVVRKRFALKADVLRHTFISMHVGKFKSVGEASLEAGNSEAIIRRHYLDRVTDGEAKAFWKIFPA